MEWSFIVAAVRRRLRFVVLCALVGALPGLLTISRSVDTFEATALVSIATPANGVAAAQPDRFIQSQISLIGSSQNLSAAAKELGKGFNARNVGADLTIEQEPETDIVRITAKSGIPKNASAIANAVAESYLKTANARLENTPEIARLNARLVELTALRTSTSNAISDAMEPYIARSANNPGGGIIPDRTQIVPEQVSILEETNAEISRVSGALADLQNAAATADTNTLVERAVTPNAPSAGIGRLLVVAGVIIGGLGGVAVALVLAQLSSKVLDESAVAAALGTTVVGSFPRSRSLLDKPRAALTSTPGDARETLERLSVRAEAMADPDIDHALTIAVVGTRPGAGTTTLTLALARRLSQSGYSVVVVDGDLRTQTISETFDASPHGGISAVLAAEVRRPSKPVEYFTPTDLARVEVLGTGRIQRREALRRDAIGPILDAARDRGQIVLYDGGSLLGSALTLFAAKAADVIVLAVPIHDQDHESLAEVADHLPSERSRVLAVATAPVRRRRTSEPDADPRRAVVTEVTDEDDDSSILGRSSSSSPSSPSSPKVETDDEARERKVESAARTTSGSSGRSSGNRPGRRPAGRRGTNGSGSSSDGGSSSSSSSTSSTSSSGEPTPKKPVTKT